MKHRKTMGHCADAAESAALTVADPRLNGRNGERIPSFISLDKLTNEVVAMRAENIYIPNEVKGVQLTDQEKNDLREGIRTSTPCAARKPASAPWPLPLELITSEETILSPSTL